MEHNKTSNRNSNKLSLNKIIVHGFQEVTVTSMISMVQNGKKYIIFIIYIIKQLLLTKSSGRHEVLLNSKLNHIGLHFASVNIKFAVHNSPCPPQHKSIIVYCH